MPDVKIEPSGRVFHVPAGASVLTAAFDAGLKLPNGCRMGTCRTCKGKVVQGTVDHGHSHPQYLTQQMRDEGFALLCQAMPCSDLVVEIEELPFLAEPQTLPCYVKALEFVSSDVARIVLRLPLHANLTFTAGQYVDLILSGERRRAYSVASCPEPTGVIDLELHVRHLPGGYFTDRLFSEVKIRDRFEIEGPLGSFFLRDSEKPAILLATGTGYAPMRSILLDAFARKSQREMVLYWGARTKADLYMFEEAQRLANEHPNFRFIPVLSRPGPEDQWSGRTGHVQDAALADIPDLQGCQVYACGSPAMVNDAEVAFATRGLPPGEYFSDAFVTEADVHHAT